MLFVCIVSTMKGEEIEDARLHLHALMSTSSPMPGVIHGDEAKAPD